MTVRDDLHRLVDLLSDDEAREWLEVIASRDPMLKALVHGPWEDEATTPDEDRDADEAWREYLEGQARPWEEVREELARE